MFESCSLRQLIKCCPIFMEYWCYEGNSLVLFPSLLGVPWLLNYFFFLFLNYFFLVLLLLLMLSQRRAANSLALIVPNFQISFTLLFFASPFSRKTWKSYCARVNSPKEIPACSAGNWNPGLQENSHCFKWEEKAGGVGLQWCSVCSASLLTPGRACWAVVTSYGTIFQSRNVNHWIWNPCKLSPFLNQKRDFFLYV